MTAVLWLPVLTAGHKLLICFGLIGWASANVARLAAWLHLDGGHAK